MEKIEEDKPYWVGFNVFSGVGPGKFKILLNVFGSAQSAWKADGSELAPILGVKVWGRFREFRKGFEPERYLKSLKLLTSPTGRRTEIQTLILPEEGYPGLLKEIDDAPPVLYCLGNLGVLTKPQIAVVGSRKMTNYGAKVGRELVRELVSAGFTITSGLAYGVDTVAHRAALDGEGETAAVLGCGVDLCYPQDHVRIYERIINCGKGVIISEIPPGIRTNRGIFVARNRIIAGLSLGVLVIEGAKKSGTLITAGYASKQGREVFAVPGPITSIYSDGPNLLIKDGAKVVRNVDDILEELGSQHGAFLRSAKSLNSLNSSLNKLELYKGAGLSDKEERVVEILIRSGVEGVHIDNIIRKSGLESGEVGSILSKLEIKGIVSSSGDGKYGLR